MKTVFKILVPVDLSEMSNQAFFTAVKIARAAGAQVIALHVVDFIVPSPFFPGDRSDYLDIRLENEKALDRLVESEEVGDVYVKKIVTVGVPEREIVHEAEHLKADLIIMSTHGRSGIGHFLLGSVAENVVRRAPCPVLTLNPGFLASSKSSAHFLWELTAAKGSLHGK